MPDLPTLPALRNPNLLRREVAPFGHDELRRGGLPYIDNPDAVLAHLAHGDEEQYRIMERSEPAISSAKGQRVHTLLTAGSEVIAGSSGRRDAEDLRGWAIQFLKGIPRWRTVQQRMLDAVYFGWQPINLVWDDCLAWRGGRYWGVTSAVDKVQERFRFNKDRHLAFIGDGFSHEPQVFSSDEDQLRWTLCAAGSLDSPYGDALYKRVWLVWYIKNRFMEMWSTGMGRSTGVLKAKEVGGAAMNAFVPPIEGDQAAKALHDIAMEVQDVVNHLATYNVIIERAGWAFEWLTNTSFSDAWRRPLEYCDKLISWALTHETLTLDVGDVGSKAAAETHRKTLIDLAVSDGHEAASWINDQLIRRAIFFNFGHVDEDDLPRLRWRLGRDAAPERVTVLHTAGVEIDWKSVAEQWHIPVQTDPVTGEVLMRQVPTIDAGKPGEDEDPADEDTPDPEAPGKKK